MAREIGCAAIKPPFVYLGLPVGQNMTRIQAWKTLRDRFITKLSRWKAKMLSIGGRLTLLKTVLGSHGSYLMSLFAIPTTVLKSLEALRTLFFGADIGERKINWVSWSRVLASKENGGLGVGSLFSFNKAMLFKWRCRFFKNPNALWVSVIKAIHGTSE